MVMNQLSPKKKRRCTLVWRKKYVRRARAAQTFLRRIRMPENARWNDAKASLNNGELETTLPKKKPKKTKKLTICLDEKNFPTFSLTEFFDADSLACSR
jgi:hypothetical protein